MSRRGLFQGYTAGRLPLGLFHVNAMQLDGRLGSYTSLVAPSLSMSLLNKWRILGVRRCADLAKSLVIFCSFLGLILLCRGSEIFNDVQVKSHPAATSLNYCFNLIFFIGRNFHYRADCGWERRHQADSLLDGLL